MLAITRGARGLEVCWKSKKVPPVVKVTAENVMSAKENMWCASDVKPPNSIRFALDPAFMLLIVTLKKRNICTVVTGVTISEKPPKEMRLKGEELITELVIEWF